MSRIEGYEFGRIVVDGTEQRRDVIVLPTRIVANWWRREGHALVMEDLLDVLEELPRRLIVGTGAMGRMRPDPGAIRELESRGIEVEAMPTHQAVRRYSELDRESAAAALHLTC